MSKIRNAVVIGAAVAALAGAVACGGGGTPDPTPTTTRPTTAAPTSKPTSKPPTSAPAHHADGGGSVGNLSAADIGLTVKTTKKDCFGSAGCNVEYRIKAGLRDGVAYRDCDVTYEVHGLEDTQTGTLNFHADGTYDQDDFQSGSTSSSSKKLTAKVVDVDCGWKKS